MVNPYYEILCSNFKEGCKSICTDMKRTPRHIKNKKQALK